MSSIKKNDESEKLIQENEHMFESFLSSWITRSRFVVMKHKTIQLRQRSTFKRCIVYVRDSTYSLWIRAGLTRISNVHMTLRKNPSRSDQLQVVGVEDLKSAIYWAIQLICEHYFYNHKCSPYFSPQFTFETSRTLL